MISSTPKKHQDPPQIILNGTKVRTPSKLTISLIMGYAAAISVYDIKGLGQANILLN